MKKESIDINRIAVLLQMFDKGLVSAQTLLDEVGLNYDSEVEKLRGESEVLACSRDPRLGGGCCSVIADCTDPDCPKTVPCSKSDCSKKCPGGKKKTKLGKIFKRGKKK